MRAGCIFLCLQPIVDLPCFRHIGKFPIARLNDALKTVNKNKREIISFYQQLVRTAFDLCTGRFGSAA
ncbi:hypothetical protein TAL182_CH03217 [Rhizobium sp. TAL182]|nr:hypothetical protein TAL182_CH03217 [Rhizobium sp. TAL182]